MKEQLYTIPLNDAINANDECPFCFIERNVEQDLLDFVLGSGSSYMESDVREATDKAGFCITPEGFLLSNRLIGELLELQEVETLANTLEKIRGGQLPGREAKQKI